MKIERKSVVITDVGGEVESIISAVVEALQAAHRELQAMTGKPAGPSTLKNAIEVRDSDGDLWRRNDDGYWDASSYSGYYSGYTLKRLQNRFGPLEVIR